jgi:hypothetical protein
VCQSCTRQVFTVTLILCYVENSAGMKPAESLPPAHVGYDSALGEPEVICEGQEPLNVRGDPRLEDRRFALVREGNVIS